MKTKITFLSVLTCFLFIANVSGQCWQSVSAGYETGAAIKPDGTLWTWGWNGFGQLGLGNTTNKTVPTKVGSATWQMVSFGPESTTSAYAMGIQTNGTLWGWGGNAQGELGIGNNIQQNSPVQVGTATNWKYIYAGNDHTVAIKTDGTLWTWGKNTYGQLGDGTTASRLTPIQVGTATNWKMAASGSSCTIAIKTDGTLWAWGQNAGGFGNGLTTNSTTPIQIGIETNWQSISCGMSTTLAIKTNGTLWAWGSNFKGQLGNGTTTSSGVPIQIGTATWKSVFTGLTASFGIRTDGTLWAWGGNSKGELGDNTIVDKLSPVQIGTANDWATIAVTSFHTFGIKTDGSLFAWGGNQISQLGLGNTTEFHVPTSVSCISGCTTAASGLYPATTYSPSCSGSQETITVDAWAGEYSNVNVLANRSYTFRSSVATDYITITNSAGTVIYASGTTPVTWVCSTSAVIRYVLSTNALCGTQDVSRTRYITCNDLSCNPPTGLTAANITTTSGTLSWTAASPAPALGYDYYYSDVNTAPTTTASGSVGAGVLTKTLTGLTTGVRYYFWVRSKCTATTTGSWVSGGSFVPQENPPCLNGTQFPTNTFTPACSGSQETIVTNAWGGEYTLVNVLASKVYTFASSVATDFITIASTDGLIVYASGVTPVIWQSNSVSGLIKYFFHTNSNCGTQQTSRGRYITCEVPCIGPVNVTVGNVSFTTAALSWTAPAVTPGLDYQYYVSTASTAPTANTVATGNIGTSSTTVSLSNLSPSTTYYYWVRSRCSASALSNWTAGGSFVTLGCDAPTNITTTTVNGGNATVSWTAPSVAPSLGYQYYYNTTGTPPTSATNPLGATALGATYVSLFQLAPSTTYFYWIRSRCDSAGYSSWASGGSFTTLSCDPPSNLSIEYTSYSIVEIDYTNPENPPSFYEYYLSTNNTSPTASTVPTGNTGGISGYTYIYDLTQSTTYYAWLRSSCGINSKSEWVSAGSFTTLTCEPLASFSINNVASSTAIINWNVENQYDDMEYYYNTTGVPPTAATQISGASIYGQTTVILGLNYSTTYYVWARKACSFTSKGPWLAANAPFTTQTGNSIVGTFVNNTTGSTLTYNQSDSVTYKFTLEFPEVWGTTNLFVFAYSNGLTPGQTLESPFNGPIDASPPATALTSTGNGTYSFTLSPVSSYFPNQEHIGSVLFMVKNYNGSIISIRGYTSLVTPILPPSANDQIFCSDATVSDLVAAAPIAKWYSTASGGTALAPSTPLTTGVYYVSQVINSSESIARTMINVTVNTISVTPAFSSICGNGVQALTTTTNIDDPILKLGSEVATNYNYTPYQGYWGGARSQALYTVAELSALGLQAGSAISSVGYKLTTGTPIQLNEFTIKAGFTAETALADFIQSPDYVVFTEAAYIPSTGNGTIDYPLATPLVWDGVSNLLVETCYSNNNNGGTPINNLDVESSEVGSQLYKHVKIDYEPNICSRLFIYQATVRPNLRIRVTTDPIITWSPVTGLYTDADATVPYVPGDSRAVVYAKPTTNTVYTSTTITSGCTSINTVSVNASFTPAPESSKQYFCPGATVANLTASGSNIKWYDAEGTLLNSGALLQSDLYFVSQTVHDCESEKTAVSVVINNTPAPEASALAFCAAATVSDLIAVGTDIKWYDTANHILAPAEALQSGIYYVSQTAHGCESDRTPVSVTINNTSLPVVSAQVFCDHALVSELVAFGENIRWYTSEGMLLSSTDIISSGTYYASQTLDGCESEKAPFSVTINGSTETSEIVTACDSYEWNGVTYTENGDYTFESLNAYGCTNIATLHLTINNSTTTEEEATACDSYDWHGENYTESGDYTFESVNASGCTNISTLHLTINHSTTSEETATACDSYEWHGETYSESGDYTYEGLNASGCAHITRLHLTINSSTASEEEVTACDSYEWHGETYAESGDYTFESTNASGCTHVTTLHLTINHTPTPISLNQTVCSGTTFESLVVSGSGIQWYSTEGIPVSGVIASSGTYGVSQTVDGCESPRNTVSLTLLDPVAAPTASAQSFCSGTVANLSASGTGISWYTAAMGGTALAADTALETGTYYTAQILDGCQSARTAVSVTIQTPMPSAPSTQVFVCGAKRTSLSATGTALKWYTVPSGGTPMSSTDLLATGTYYVSQTIGGCQSSRRAVQVTVNIISPPVAFDQVYCYNATVMSLTATGSNLKWYLSQSGGTALATTTGLTAGTYYVSQKTGTCESARIAIQVSLSGPALPEAPSPQVFNCGAKRTSLLATGVGLKWYTSATGGSAISSTTQLVTGLYYVSQTVAGCEGPRREVSVTIINPNPPTAAEQVFCTAATVANLFATGSNIKWYISDTDTTPLASTTPLVTGTYYASQTNSMLCESARTAVQVSTGGAPMPDALSPQVLVCGAKRTSLTATGTSLLWYTVSSGGTALSSTALLVSGTYYVSQTISGCVSARREVTVVITNPSAPPAPAQALCPGATVANLYAAGTNLNWYASAMGGTALATNTLLTTGNYYVSQSAGSCESERTAVTVTLNTTPMPDASSPQVFSCNVKRTSLVATGTGLLWYTSATGGSALSSATQLSTGTYYVSQTIDGCASARRAVSVTVNATAPPTVSDQVLCIGEHVSDLAVTGTSIKWYTAATGGMALMGSTTLSAGTYYASQTLNGCESFRSASTVTLTDCAVRAPETVQATPTQSAEVASVYSIRVYPNPAASVINIRPEGDFIIDGIMIVDSTGRIITEKQGNITEMEVSMFARGVYILRAFSAGKQYQAKFVKE